MAAQVAPSPPPADRIEKAFDELEAQKTLIINCTHLWTSLRSHFSSLHRSLADRSQALDANLHSLQSDYHAALAALDARDAALPARESAAAALIDDCLRSALDEIENPDAKPPQDLPSLLRWYARRMDAAGLWRLMLLRRKDLAVLRRETSDAVCAAVDPARLVLDAIDDFVANPSPPASGGGDKCWAFGLLLRALYDVEEGKKLEVAGSIRGRAAEVAAAWKAKAEEKGGGMGSSEGQMLLQMVVAFDLQEKFEQEMLRKLVLEHASRKEMPKLAAGLGFGEKLADVIDELVKTGKELEAVYFSYESGLTKQFSPVSLLKSHLQNTKKKTNTILKNGNHSSAAKEEANNLELNTLRSIIKCVETYKLEPEFALDGPRKRVAQLEKAKADKKTAAKADKKTAATADKRTAAAYKSQMKRARGAGAPPFRPFKSTRTSNTTYPTGHQNPSPRYQVPLARHSYYPGHGGLDGSVPPSYGAAALSRSPAQISQQYYVPEDIGGLRGGMPSYGGPSVAYGAYDYAASHSAPTEQMPYPR